MRRHTPHCNWRNTETSHCQVRFSTNASQVSVFFQAITEAASRAAREYIASACANEAFVKIDFSNRFNSVRRDTMFDCIAEHAPEILQFVKSCYKESSFLLHGDYIIKSAEGFQQGDPLATFAFCLVLHACLKELVSKLRLGYLDDVSFGDYWRTALRDLIVLRKNTERVGLQLNVKKCEITAFGPNKETIESEFSAKFPNITVVNPSMTTLMGAGLGEEAIRCELKSKLDNVKRLTERTHQLPSQAAFFLMKNCFMMPKLMYVL